MFPNVRPRLEERGRRVRHLHDFWVLDLDLHPSSLGSFSGSHTKEMASPLYNSGKILRSKAVSTRLIQKNLSSGVFNNAFLPGTEKYLTKWMGWGPGPTVQETVYSLHTVRRRYVSLLFPSMDCGKIEIVPHPASAGTIIVSTNRRFRGPCRRDPWLVQASPAFSQNPGPNFRLHEAVRFISPPFISSELTTPKPADILCLVGNSVAVGGDRYRNRNRQMRRGSATTQCLTHVVDLSSGALSNGDNHPHPRCHHGQVESARAHGPD